VAAVGSIRESQFDEAREYVDRCLRDTPDDPSCLAASAQLAVHDRDLTLAGITIWRLSQIAPDSADTFLTRAQLAELQHDLTAATRSYRSACEAGEPSACQRLSDLSTQ